MNTDKHILMECSVSRAQNWKPEGEMLFSGEFDFSLPAGSVPGGLRAGSRAYAAIPKFAVVVLGEGAPG